MTDKEKEEITKRWDELMGRLYVLGYHKFVAALKLSIEPVLLGLENTESLVFMDSMSTVLVTDVPIANAMASFIPKVSDRTSRFLLKNYIKYLPKGTSLSVGFGSEIFAREMNEYLRTVGADHVKEITDTTKRMVKKAISDSIENKETIKQAAKRIERYTLGGLDGRINRRARALLIARTETLMASSKAKDIRMINSGIEVLKEWIHDHPKVPRQTHIDVAISSKKKPLEADEYFIVGGKKMKYAGDRNGGIENLANCRCSTIYIPK